MVPTRIPHSAFIRIKSLNHPLARFCFEYAQLQQRSYVGYFSSPPPQPWLLRITVPKFLERIAGSAGSGVASGIELLACRLQ